MTVEEIAGACAARIDEITDERDRITGALDHLVDDDPLLWDAVELQSSEGSAILHSEFAMDLLGAS